jgi:hypothetical protein
MKQEQMYEYPEMNIRKYRLSFCHLHVFVFVLRVRIRKTRSKDILKFLLLFTRVWTAAPIRSLPCTGTIHQIIIAPPDLVRVNSHADAPVIFLPKHRHRPLRAFRARIVRRDGISDGIQHRLRRGVLGQAERSAESAHGGGLCAEHVRRLLVAQERYERAVEGCVWERRARVQRGVGERA